MGICFARGLTIALSLLAGLAGGGAFAGSVECRPDLLQVKTPAGEVRLRVEVADTDATRARGLMWREHLDAGAGMIFIYDRPQVAQFWMRNTLIPLDMIFADETGTVQHVHAGARPKDDTVIDGGDNILGVLEINAGLARRLGIGPGSVIRHPGFSPQKAAWPCN